MTQAQIKSELVANFWQSQLLYSIIQMKNLQTNISLMDIWGLSSNWNELILQNKNLPMKTRNKDIENLSYLFFQLLISLKKIFQFYQLFKNFKFMNLSNSIFKFSKKLNEDKQERFLLFCSKIFYVKIYKVKKVLQTFFPFLIDFRFNQK